MIPDTSLAAFLASQGISEQGDNPGTYVTSDGGIVGGLQDALSAGSGYNVDNILGNAGYIRIGPGTVPQSNIDSINQAYGLNLRNAEDYYKYLYGGGTVVNDPVNGPLLQVPGGGPVSQAQEVHTPPSFNDPGGGLLGFISPELIKGALLSTIGGTALSALGVPSFGDLVRNAVGSNVPVDPYAIDGAQGSRNLADILTGSSAQTPQPSIPLDTATTSPYIPIPSQTSIPLDSTISAPASAPASAAASGTANLGELSGSSTIDLSNSGTTPLTDPINSSGAFPTPNVTDLGLPQLPLADAALTAGSASPVFNGQTVDLGNSDGPLVNPTDGAVTPGIGNNIPVDPYAIDGAQGSRNLDDILSTPTLAVTPGLGNILSGLGGVGSLGSLGKSLLGLGSGIADAVGINQRNALLKDIADRSFAVGAPSRARFEAANTPGFDINTIPGYSSALQTSADAFTRSLSAKEGNPFGTGSAQAETQKYLMGSLGLPTYQNYVNTQANAGGFAPLAGQANQVATNSANATADVYGNIGKTAQNVFNPPSDLQTLLTQLGPNGLAGLANLNQLSGQNSSGLFNALR